MEHLDLILTAIGCTASGVWLLRAAIDRVAMSLAVHKAENAAEHSKMGAEIIALKSRKRR